MYFNNVFAERSLTYSVRDLSVNHRYNLSFTVGPLKPDLIRILAEHYLTAGSWKDATRRVVTSNAFQCRSFSSLIRWETELRGRLETLTDEQITLLAQGVSGDRMAMAWLATLKRNKVVFDFSAEVLRDKLTTCDPVLRYSDYESFIDAKSVSHPELRKLSPVSQVRIRRVLFQMLKESGLLIEGAALGKIQRPFLTPAVYRVVAFDQPYWLAGFLVSDEEIALQIALNRDLKEGEES